MAAGSGTGSLSSVSATAVSSEDAAACAWGSAG